MDAVIVIGLLFVGLIPGLYMLAQYNALVALRNRIREAWGAIDAELARRYDLIPRLIEAARGCAAHEREVFERVAALRERCAANRGSVNSQAKDESELVAGLQTLLARIESYPQLKADAPFQNLHRELVATEDRIQAARRFFNDHVRGYRNKCESFPSSLVAQMFGFQVTGFFEVEPAVRDAPAAS